MSRCPEGRNCDYCGARTGARHRDARNMKPIDEWDTYRGFDCWCCFDGAPDPWEKQEWCLFGGDHIQAVCSCSEEKERCQSDQVSTTNTSHE